MEDKSRKQTQRETQERNEALLRLVATGLTLEQAQDLLDGFLKLKQISIKAKQLHSLLENIDSVGPVVGSVGLFVLVSPEKEDALIGLLEEIVTEAGGCIQQESAVLDDERAKIMAGKPAIPRKRIIH